MRLSTFHLVYCLQTAFLRAGRNTCDTLPRNRCGYCAMIATMHGSHMLLPYHHTRYLSRPALVYPLAWQVPRVIDHLPLFYRELALWPYLAMRYNVCQYGYLHSRLLKFVKITV